MKNWTQVFLWFMAIQFGALSIFQIQVSGEWVFGIIDLLFSAWNIYMALEEGKP